MKCIVTGSCGFIGSHLTEACLARGDIVIAIDDLSEGRLENLPVHDNLSVHKASILDDIGFLFSGVDVVFHLAALPRPQLSIVDPRPAHDVNVNGTLEVLMACRKHKVKRVVFASSASVYGEQADYPTPETARPNPMSPYALHKVIGEQYLELFAKLYGLEYNALRLFNVYGPRMNPNGEYASLIPKFINMIYENHPPTIYGSGEQARDFVYISDVVDAFLRASECGAVNQVFNIGWGINYSVNEVTTSILGLMGSNLKPIHVAPVIEPTQTLADIKKSFSMMGWCPKTTLADGLRKLYEGLE